MFDTSVPSLKTSTRLFVHCVVNIWIQWYWCVIGIVEKKQLIISIVIFRFLDINALPAIGSRERKSKKKKMYAMRYCNYWVSNRAKRVEEIDHRESSFVADFISDRITHRAEYRMWPITCYRAIALKLLIISKNVSDKSFSVSEGRHTGSPHFFIGGGAEATSRSTPLF